MPHQIEGATQRFALLQNHGLQPRETVSGGKLTLYRGCESEFQGTLFVDTPSAETLVTDFTNVDSIELVVRRYGPKGAILFVKELTSTEIDLSVTFVDWENEIKEHFTIPITEVDTTVDVPDSGKLPLFFVITLLSTTDERFVVGFGSGDLFDVGFINSLPVTDLVTGRTPIVGGKLLSDLDLNGFDIVDSGASAVYLEEGKIVLTANQLTINGAYLVQKADADGYRFGYLYIKDTAGNPRDVRPFLNDQTQTGFTVQLNAGATAGAILYWRTEPKLPTLPSPAPAPRFAPLPAPGTPVLYQIWDKGGHFNDVRAHRGVVDGVVDDSDALAETIAAAQAGTRMVFVSGRLRITRPFTVTGVPVAFVGIGNGYGGNAGPGVGPSTAAEIFYDGAATAFMFNMLELNYGGWGFHNIKLDGRTNAADVLQLNGCTGGLCTNLNIAGSGSGSGMKWAGTVNTPFDWTTFINLDISMAGNGKACLWMHNGSVNRIYGLRIYHEGNRVGIWEGGVDNNKLDSVFIFRDGAGTGAGVLRDTTELSGFPTNNHWFNLETGTGGHVTLAGGAQPVVPDTIWGYAHDNGEPEPVVNGYPLLVEGNERAMIFTRSTPLVVPGPSQGISVTFTGVGAHDKLSVTSFVEVDTAGVFYTIIYSGTPGVVLIVARNETGGSVTIPPGGYLITAKRFYL